MKNLCFLMMALFALPTISPVQAQEEKNPALVVKDLSGFRPRLGENASTGEDGESYKVDASIRMAAKIQALGKEKGSAYLLSLSQRSDTPFILARMVFVPKKGVEFRGPAIGRPFVLGGTPFEFWPLQPIELVDGIPFHIVTGYFLGGIPETPEQYVNYCLKNCDWNPVRFKPKSKQEKQQALKNLLYSPMWGRPLTSFEKGFLTDQIK